MTDVKTMIESTAQALVLWRNNIEMENETNGTGRANTTGQCHPRVTGGSTPPAANTEVDDTGSDNPEPSHDSDDITGEVTSDQTMVADHIRWNDNHNQPIRVPCESNRTHYGLSEGGRTPKNRSRRTEATGTTKGLNDKQAIARARVKAMKRVVKRERQSKEWKTLT